MTLRTITLGAGVLGGLAWLVRMVLHLADSAVSGAGQLLEPLYWAGLGLLAVAVAGAGAGLVSSSAGWLRLVVAVAFPLLVWSVLEALHPAGDPAVVDGVFAVLVLLVAAVQSRRRPASRGQPQRRHGSHAR